MAKEDNKLADLLNQMGSTLPEGVEETLENGTKGAQENASGEEAKATDGEKKKREVKNASEFFRSEGVTSGIVNPDSQEGQLKKAWSQIASIAGFITPASPKLAIALQTRKISEKDVTPEVRETNINLKESFGSTPKGIIYNTCAELEDRIKQVQRSSDAAPTKQIVVGLDGKQQEIAAKTAAEFIESRSTLIMSTKIKNYNEFIEQVLNYGWFAISEAPEIFWAHTKVSTRTDKDTGEKKTTTSVINSAADLSKTQNTDYRLVHKYATAKENYEKKVATYAGLSDEERKKQKAPKKPLLKDIFPLRSNYRSRLACPGNFIAIKEFKTQPVRPSYTPEQAEQMNRMYVEKAFPKKAETLQNKLATLTETARTRVSITDEGKVTSSQFFAPQNSLVADAAYLESIKRWWGPETFKVTTAKLVQRKIEHIEEKTSSTGNVTPAHDRIIDEFIPFGEAGNKLTDDRYAKIVKATDSRLTESMVNEFIASLRNTSDKEGKVYDGVRNDVGFDATVIMSLVSGWAE